MAGNLNSQAVNEHVWPLHDDVPSTPWLKGLPKLLERLLTVPLFFTSFMGIDNNPSENKQYTYYGYRNSPEDMKVFEKVTRQPYYKDSFPQISNSLGDKLYLILMGIFHARVQEESIMAQKSYQGLF